MITPWEIYWVLQLDSIRACLVTVAVLSGPVAALTLFIGAMARDCMDLSDESWARAKRMVKRLTVTLCVSLALASLLPSTKTAAAMIIVPKIVNSLTIQHEAGDIYNLAKQALRDAIAPKQRK